MKYKFFNWMSKKTKLSENSIRKYVTGVTVVSKEMQTEGIIMKPLIEMNLYELDIALGLILKNEIFVAKNTRGKGMYSNSLKQYRYFIIDSAEFTTEDIHLKTETTSIIKSRVGQNEYRKKLMEKYNSKCVITGIDLPRLLIASHIKPWSVSSDNERLDVENGFLLSANFDVLFDCGLISFKDKGEILVSSFIGNENQKKLNITKDIKIDLKATNSLLNYLEYHRDIIFVK